MFILKRQDVEISSIQHPKKDQKIPILTYQGQTFRLISIFNANQEEDAKAFWRDLTDNQGKACVLLEEPERYSVWGKIRLEQLGSEGQASEDASAPAYTQGCLLMLQAIYIDIEDLMGTKQSTAFQKDIGDVMKQWHFPQGETPDGVKNLLTLDPLDAQLPPWQEHHLNTLLQELHRIAKGYFGKSPFAGRALEALQDMTDGDRKLFTTWLSQSPLGKLWR